MSKNNDVGGHTTSIHTCRVPGFQKGERHVYSCNTQDNVFNCHVGQSIACLMFVGLGLDFFINEQCGFLSKSVCLKVNLEDQC